MYGFIWRHLPGPKWLKFIEATLLVLGIVYLLFQFFFPDVMMKLPMFDTTVGE